MPEPTSERGKLLIDTPLPPETPEDLERNAAATEKIRLEVERKEAERKRQARIGGYFRTLGNLFKPKS